MTDHGRMIEANGPARARSARNAWAHAGTEPRLDEVLADPLVQLVMRRDRVSPLQLRVLVAEAQARLRGDLCCRFAA
jgi:hypothetical protein